MKKLTTAADIGGAPIYKADLRELFTQEVWDIIQGFLYKIDGLAQGAIFSGCVITNHGGSTFDMTAGIVYLNGEFMRILAASGLSYPQYIQPDTIINNDRVFSDGSTHTVTKDSKAKYNGATPGSGQYIAITTTGDLGGPGGFRLENYVPVGVQNAINSATSGLSSKADTAQGGNANSFTTSGIYYGTGTNFPNGSDAFMIITTITLATPSIFQVAINLNGSAGATGDIWLRSYNGSWSSWTSVNT